jgi:prevent-host-death family protein
MGSIASRDLRNHTADVLQRVRQGERVAVTVHGEVVAELVPPTTARRRFLSRRELADLLLSAAADPGLRADLAALGDETTDDLQDLD